MLGLQCEPKWVKSLIPCSMFISWAISAIFLPRFADIYGRKPLYIASVTGFTLSYAIMFYIDNPYQMILLFAFNGILASILYSVGPIYMYENVPSNRLAITGTVFSVIDLFTYLLAVLFFYMVSKDW